LRTKVFKEPKIDLVRFNGLLRAILLVNLRHSLLWPERALERDHFMTAKEALNFGIIDKIVERRPPTTSDADKQEKS
jgi:ATP-dependent protease ClpP protease subunit